MSFIGPRPISLDQVSAADRLASKRFDIRPGLVSLWWLRQRANIAYTSESAIDVEYVDTQSFWGDLGIAARAIPALIAGQGVGRAPDRIGLLGITLDNLTMTEATASIMAMIREQNRRQVCFVNADCVNIAFRDSEYGAVLRRASLVLGDGIGIRIAGALLNKHIRQNVNGTDLLPFLCSSLEQEGHSIYLLGGRPGVAERAADALQQRFPRLQIAGCRHGYFTADREEEVIRAVRESGARVLLVALGAPKQDVWIARHSEELGTCIALGVGGLLDFYSGRIPRAPLWMRELSLEWLFRFAQEPKRLWKRYLIGNWLFLGRVMYERLTAEGRRELGVIE
jgi:N-acetylglucosaminyldiphosphoundecaprenol N-acetyl-beta-D-mannosaminyltransferase